VLDITPIKVMIVLVVALIVLGPERLPRLAHQAARGWRDLQRFRHHLGSEVRETVLGESPTRPTETTAHDPAQSPNRDHGGAETTGSTTEEPAPHQPGLN
jgi:Sec-independent protein translocase protein TatA